MTIARQIKEKADSEDVLRKQIKTLAQIEQGGRQMNGAIQDKAIDMALDALEVDEQATGKDQPEVSRNSPYEREESGHSSLQEQH